MPRMRDTAVMGPPLHFRSPWYMRWLSPVLALFYVVDFFLRPTAIHVVLCVGWGAILRAVVVRDGHGRR